MLYAFILQVFQKETPTQLLSFEAYKTVKSTYFEEDLEMAAS